MLQKESKATVQNIQIHIHIYRMDLEHTKLGDHCDHSSCNQRDFLPFRCNVCNKNYCLDHRSYMSHNCLGQHLCDITSIECPLCATTIKFNKTVDPNIAWEEHFLICKQIPVKKIMDGKFCSSCKIKLGLSNHFTCKKCSKLLCLLHRNSEDHQCVISVKASVVGTKKTLTPQQEEALKRLKSRPVVASNSSNAVRETAGRRMINPAGSTSSATSSAAAVDCTGDKTILCCPFCNEKYVDETSMYKHIDSKHPPSAPTTSTTRPTLPNAYLPNPVPSSNSSNDSVCPLCSSTFSDPVDLVAHYEVAHAAPTTSTSGKNTNKRNSSSDCSLN